MGKYRYLTKFYTNKTKYQEMDKIPNIKVSINTIINFRKLWQVKPTLANVKNDLNKQTMLILFYYLRGMVQFILSFKKLRILTKVGFIQDKIVKMGYWSMWTSCCGF